MVAWGLRYCSYWGGGGEVLIFFVRGNVDKNILGAMLFPER
jgi:hypothetical protein